MYYVEDYYTNEIITCTFDFKLACKLCNMYENSQVTDENGNVYYLNIDLPF